MGLEETLKHLQELGAEYIQDKTHISLYAVKAILEQNFTAIHAIQFAGFLNIIENELHMDMTPLRNALKEHNEHHNIGKTQEPLFVYTPNYEANKKIIYSVVAFVLVIIVLYFTFSSSNSEQEVAPQNSAIVEASSSIESIQEPEQQEAVIEEDPETVSKPSSSIARFNPVVAKDNPVDTNHPFMIYPSGDLWIGVIDIDTKSKKDTITNKPYALDENTNLLISLGHGQVKIVLNGEAINSNSTLPLRYMYKDGKLSRLSFAQFKELNEGNSW